jgi:ribosomal protein S18 acetylase RimI-like enzyme
MRTFDEITERLRQYRGAQFIYNEYGYIAWQCSTGENYEILFIEVNQKRQGAGTKLIVQMKSMIQPYHSIFVFCRANNMEARAFYKSLGFQEHVIKGLYREEDAILCTIPYNSL